MQLFAPALLGSDADRVACLHSLHPVVCGCAQGEGGAVAGAVLAVSVGPGPPSRAATPSTPPAHTAQTPQVTRRDPTRRLPGMGECC